MGLFLIDLGVSTARLPAVHAEIGLDAFFTSMTGLRAAFDVLGLACAGGLFVVPLFTAIQADAPPAWRARIVGGVNVLNSVFIVAGVAATAALQSKFDRPHRTGAAHRPRRLDAGLRRLRSAIRWRATPDGDDHGVLRRNNPNARGPSPTCISPVTFSVCASMA